MRALAGWREAEWHDVGAVHFLALLGTALAMAIYYNESHEDFVPIIDHVNLAFHETGHLVFGMFGKWPGILGGTLGQLVMPLLAAVAFWRKGATFSFALTGLWFFQNFFNIARYMADARARLLPLVGGGDHDWTNLFFHWNVLAQDTVIAGWTTMLGVLGCVTVLAWLGWRAFIRQ
ncbi:MAG: hypothetical protein R3270_01380 [Gammaproteobacteria bacterium]|nr:hypothetical protein [Gammaproteobacteria bacterium]